MPARIQSLEKQINENLEPLAKAKKLTELAWNLQEVDMTQATKYLEQVFELTKKHPESVERAEAYYVSAWIDKHEERLDMGFEKLLEAKRIYALQNDAYHKHKVDLEIGMYFSNKGKHTKADSIFRRANKRFEAIYPQTFFYALSLQYMGIHKLRTGFLKESITYFQKAATLYEDLDEKLWLARAHGNTGLAYKNLQFTRLALEYYLKALIIYERVGIAHHHFTTTLINVGNMYAVLRDSSSIDVAMRYFKEARKQAELQKNYLQVSHALDGIGKMLIIQKNYKGALAYLDTSMQTSVKHKLILKQAYTRFEKAEAYLKMQQYTKSEWEVRDALAIFEKEQVFHSIMQGWILLGNIYSQNKNYEQAHTFYKKADKIANETKNNFFVLSTQYMLANSFVNLQKYEEAEQYARKIYRSSNQNGMEKSKMEVCLLLSKINAYKKDYTVAFDWLQKHNQLKDSLNEVKNWQTTREIQALYDFEKQQKTNEILQKDNLLQEYKLYQRNLWLLILSILLVSALSLAGFLFYFSYFQQKKNKEINAKNQELEDSNTFKTKLISIIAHDLRRPYANLMGTLQLIRAGDLDMEEQIFLLEHIEKQTLNTQEFIESLLFWAKSQAGVFKYNPIAFDCFIISMSVQSFLEEQAKQKNITIENQIPFDSYVYADMEMVKIILVNLCANALKFSYPSSKIQIQFQSEPHQNIIIVQDFGLGISPENQTKINKGTSFYTSGTKGESGFGLGLMICYDLAERMAGKLHFESEVGKGTIFKLTLPARI